jgi:hypothetical protein
MVHTFIIMIAMVLTPPTIEQERVGVEVSISYGALKDFPHSIGGGTDILFITGEKLGGSLGFSILKSEGESLCREIMQGAELQSSTSSKYISFVGFYIDYLFYQKKLSPFAGAGINWVYYHEQSKSVYTVPGYIITCWNNYNANGYSFSGVLGLRYIINPHLSFEPKVEMHFGNFYYPALEENIGVKGIFFTLGCRI